MPTTLAEVQEPVIYTQAVHALTWLPCGIRILGVSYDDVLLLHDLATGGERRARWSDGGKVDPHLAIRLAETTSMTERVLPYEYRQAVAFSPCGRRAVTAWLDSAWIWDTETGETIVELNSPGLARLGPLALSSNASRLVSASLFNHRSQLWDAQTGALLHSSTAGTPHLRPEHSLESAGDSAAAGDFPNHLRIVSRICSVLPRGGPQSSQRSSDISPTTCLALSPDGNRVLLGFQNGTLHVQHALTDEILVRTLQAHEGEVTCVAFSPDGTRFASGSNDESICVWNTDTGERLSRIGPEWPSGGIASVAFSPDGSRLASCSGRTVEFWDVMGDWKRWDVS